MATGRRSRRAVGFSVFLLVQRVSSAELSRGRRAEAVVGSNTSALQTLNYFCGLALGGQHVSQPMVVDCSCCAGLLVGDYAAQVELLFGGEQTMATARDADAAAPLGEVPLWSIGEHIPDVVCDDILAKSEEGGQQKVVKQPFCTCSNKDTSWAEFEPSCRAGPSCRWEAPPEEWPTVCAEGVSCSARDQALGRDGGGEPTVRRSDDDNACSSLGPGPVPKGRTPSSDTISRRMSLGSARCEDMSAEQCHLFYSKVGGRWHHCEATTTVRKCAAVAVKKADAEAEAASLEAWAIKHAYSPDAWPVKVLEDATVAAVDRPSREDLMDGLQHLPLRSRFRDKPWPV